MKTSTTQELRQAINAGSVRYVTPELLDHIERLEAENSRLAMDLLTTENALVEQGSVLEWVEAALEGNEVSEFAESFPLVAKVIELKANGIPVAHDLKDWHEDDGAVLWWTMPVEEPPYVGTPLDDDWPGYHTHWTVLEVPEDIE